ncbi:hypothetical protein HZH68_003734 [Vespula germanica]|uniref:Uncharacterized protein n=1 Tax=Vespula germanica TaxID=30212 RepID=A0A834U3D2_VESGE|nr:hypothetical protein HZH68_003734 [Vespula germanica]
MIAVHLAQGDIHLARGNGRARRFDRTLEKSAGGPEESRDERQTDEELQMRGPPSGPRGVLRERLSSARARAAVVSQDRTGEQKRVGGRPFLLCFCSAFYTPHRYPCEGILSVGDGGGGGGRAAT